MSGRFKYIIIWSSKLGMEAAILLPEFLSHDQCVNPAKCQLVSAGFVEIRDGLIIVCRGSDSLGVNSRAKDAEIICETLAMSGVRSLQAVSENAQTLAHP